MEKPTMKQRLESLGTFIWDSENGKVLGRGGRSWVEISVFYLIYYACLASFFAATLAVFYETISDHEPKLQKDSSLLDGNPGLGFRPRVDLDNAKVSAKPVLGKNKDYKKDLDNFLKKYEKVGGSDCGAIVTTRRGEKEGCKVELDDLTTNCKPENDYGFADGKPCVLIKLNKVFGWEPELWKNANDAKFPVTWGLQYDPQIIPLRCYAKEKGDQDKLGDLAYYPQQGFPIKYYPFEGQRTYRAPLVFVQFQNITRGNTIEVECRAYAKNIEYDRTEMQGSIKFKVYVAK